MNELAYIKPKRGRKPGVKNGPKVEKTRFSQNIIIDGPRKFQRETLDESTGIKTIWKYDYDKSKSGLVEVENIYPEGYVDEMPGNDEDLPLTKREWLNPKNGKMVSYSRAVQLGLYVPEKGEGKRGRPSKK